MSGSLNVRLLVARVQKISDWFMLGVHLGVPNEELNKIDQRFSASHGVERCKAELFDLWLRRNSNARWDDVASALEQLNEMALASELREQCRIFSSPVATRRLATSPQPELAQDQEVIRVELSKMTVKQFKLLERKFASLVCKIKTMIIKKGVLSAELHSFLEVRLYKTIEFCPISTTISDLFKYITPYYCFLNTTLLEDIIDEFLGEPLQQQLDEYEGLLEEFTSSTKISLLKEIDLKTAAQHKGMPLVVLKLSGRCLDVTIKRFQELVRYVFGKISSALSNILVEDGCICITWNTRESAVPSLIETANEKIQFMKHVGILRLTVGDVTIFEQPGMEEEWEEDNSSLEDYLMQSVASGCNQAVEFLLSAGADPNFQTDTGQTALLSVDYSEQSSFVLVKSLLEAGAEVNMQNNEGWSSLTMACNYGCYEIAELLIQYGADVQLSTLDNFTPLMLACNYKYEDIAALLLRSNADPNLQNYRDQTALMLACENQLTQTVSLLLSSGADPNLQNESGWTALMFSLAFYARMLDDRIPVLLLSAGANPNIQSNAGFTALMVAVRYNGSACIGILLSAQANVNAQDQTGNTVLHCLASYGDLTSTELLLSAGADPSLVNSAGETPVDVALKHQQNEICQLLLSYSTTKFTETTTQQKINLLVPPQGTTSSSSVSTTPHHELDQLRFALHHPLPPAATTKHDVQKSEDEEKEYFNFSQ